MKTMTCKQIGGACDLVFKAETFEDLVEQSKKHGMEMFQQSDADHMKAISETMQRMQNPEAMQTWLEEKKAEFEALPNS